MLGRSARSDDPHDKERALFVENYRSTAAVVAVVVDSHINSRPKFSP